MKKAGIVFLCLGIAVIMAACASEENNQSQTADHTPQTSADSTASKASEASPADDAPAASSGKVDEGTSVPSDAAGSETAYQELGELLLKELGEKAVSKVTVLNDHGIMPFMGYEPLERANKFKADSEIEIHAEIDSAAEIAALKEVLKADHWQVVPMTLQSMPKVFLYFDSDLHVNLEAQTDDASWMSIHSPTGTAFYHVPKEAYDILFEKYGM